MEHVINSKFRNQAFWKFLIFFLVTTGIVLTTAFFDTKIPASQNAMLMKKIANYENQIYNEQQFIIKADSVQALIDSLNRSGGNYDYINSLIGEKLARMTSLVYGMDSSNIYIPINKKILYTYTSFHRTKQLLVDNESQQIATLKNQLQECQNNLDEAKENARILGRTNF